ncbi:ATP-binding protein [Streptomyces sp. NPDC049555]|uniref:ATP-binding protein n=1 Tax=Streptomyces sp. NPDC049555 TaxID=3154930 RepID=UPI0034176D1B
MRRVLAAAGLAASTLTMAAAGPAAALPRVPDVAGLGVTVDTAAQRATAVAGDAGGRAVRRTVPAAGRTGGTAVRTTTAAARRLAREATGSASDILGETSTSATRAGLPAGGLPTKGLPRVDRLPAVDITGLG